MFNHYFKMLWNALWILEFHHTVQSGMDFMVSSMSKFQKKMHCSEINPDLLTWGVCRDPLDPKTNILQHSENYYVIIDRLLGLTSDKSDRWDLTRQETYNSSLIWGPTFFFRKGGKNSEIPHCICRWKLFFGNVGLEYLPPNIPSLFAKYWTPI